MVHFFRFLLSSGTVKSLAQDVKLLTFSFSHGISLKAAVLTEVLRTRDMAALEHAPPLALRRPLPLVVSVQHGVHLHPDAQATLGGDDDEDFDYQKSFHRDFC